VSALVLDAGALIAIDRGDRRVLSEVDHALQSRLPVRTNAMAWRDGGGRQATLARALRDITVASIAGEDGMRAGEVLGATRMRDAIDASVAFLAGSGDRVLTSDPADLQALCGAAGDDAVVVDC
jgi:hypothetical protein